jgi:hypothetical protein
MKRYRLINKKNKDQHLCEKVRVYGFDYYIAHIETPVDGKQYFNVWDDRVWTYKEKPCPMPYWGNLTTLREIIATTDTILPDLPEIDTVDQNQCDAIELAEKFVKGHPDYAAEGFSEYQNGLLNGFIEGYMAHNKTNPFTKEDLIAFHRWVRRSQWQDYNDLIPNTFINKYDERKTTVEIIELWTKESRIETIYFN